MKKTNFLFITLISFFSSYSATVTEYPEDIYLVQADKETIEKANSIADKIGYQGDYQIAFPKKAGLEINPANKFISSAINPQTQIPFIVLNPDWFKALDAQEQDAFLSLAFERCISGSQSPLSQYIVWIYALISWIIIFALFIILKKFSFIPTAKWKRFVIALLSVFAFNLVFAPKIQNSIVNYLNKKHDMKIYAAVIAKGTDRKVIINALQKFDKAIMQELENGQLFWQPYKGKYPEYIRILSNN